MGRIQVCSMHVDLHKRSVDKRTDTRQGTGRVPEETHTVHYALRKLGLRGCLRRSRMCVVKNNFPAGRRNFERGTEFFNRNPVRGAMEPTVVLSDHELEPKLGKCFESQDVSRNRQ